MHSGKTMNVGGVLLTVAPSQDGRLNIAVGASMAHLTELEAADFLARALDVCRDLFEANADRPEGFHERPEESADVATDPPDEPLADAATTMTEDEPEAPSEVETLPAPPEE